MKTSLELNSYRVEVSGWDSAQNFFVEKTMLTWTHDGQKQVTVRADLKKDCMLFVRLLQSTRMPSNIPMAYQATQVTQKEADGRKRVSMVQMRSRVAEGSGNAMSDSRWEVA